MNFFNNNKIQRLMTNKPAGITVLESDIIDTASCKGVGFIIELGNVVDKAKITLTLQGSNTDDPDTMKNYKDSEIVIEDATGYSGKVVGIELIPYPDYRYSRLVIKRENQNSAVNSVVSVIYGTRKLPVKQDGLMDCKLVISPETVGK